MNYARKIVEILMRLEHIGRVGGLKITNLVSMSNK